MRREIGKAPLFFVRVCLLASAITLANACRTPHASEYSGQTSGTASAAASDSRTSIQALKADGSFANSGFDRNSKESFNHYDSGFLYRENQLTCDDNDCFPKATTKITTYCYIGQAPQVCAILSKLEDNYDSGSGEHDYGEVKSCGLNAKDPSVIELAYDLDTDYQKYTIHIATSIQQCQGKPAATAPETINLLTGGATKVHKLDATGSIYASFGVKTKATFNQIDSGFAYKGNQLACSGIHCQLKSPSYAPTLCFTGKAADVCKVFGQIEVNTEDDDSSDQYYGTLEKCQVKAQRASVSYRLYTDFTRNQITVNSVVSPCK